MSEAAFIDARCGCEACESRTSDIYRMVSLPCSNCGAGPFLLLYRAGDKAADQDCPVCQAYWSVKASRLATPDEVPAGGPVPEREDS